MEIIGFLPDVAKESILALILICCLLAVWKYVQRKDQDRRDTEAADRAERAANQKLLIDLHERSISAHNTVASNTAGLSTAIGDLRQTISHQNEAFMAKFDDLGAKLDRQPRAVNGSGRNKQAIA